MNQIGRKTAIRHGNTVADPSSWPEPKEPTRWRKTCQARQR